MHPSILPADFDITPSGELVLNLPASPADSFQNGYDPESANGNAKPNLHQSKVPQASGASEATPKNVRLFYAQIKCRLISANALLTYYVMRRLEKIIHTLNCFE